MAISEAARHDLYTGLNELLGPERTETLMSALPVHDLDEVATKGDLAELRAELKGDIAELRAELKGDIAELNGGLIGLRSELKGDFAVLGSKVDALQVDLRATNKRLDRLIFAMIGGLVAIIVALAGIIINL